MGQNPNLESDAKRLATTVLDLTATDHPNVESWHLRHIRSFSNDRGEPLVKFALAPAAHDFHTTCDPKVIVNTATQNVEYSE